MENKNTQYKEEFIFTRDSKWGIYDGRKIPIKDLEDSHILNLLGYLGRRVNNYREQVEELRKDLSLEYSVLLADLKQRHVEKNLVILNVINEEIEIRNLDRSKADGEHSLPFKKDGVWMEWKKDFPRPTPIPSSIDFMSPIEDRVKNLRRDADEQS